MQVAQSCPTLCHPMNYKVNGIFQARILEWVAFLQGIFPTQRLNSGLPHYRWIFYQLSHKGSPWIMEWVFDPFSSRSSQCRNWTRFSCIAGRLFTNWAKKEAPIRTYMSIITLNMNSLIAPIKRHRLAEWIQKQESYICCLQEIHIKLKTHTDWRWRDGKKKSTMQIEIKRKLE